ncbi:FAD-dependent monooxygenase [Mucilaginibacter sp. RB4R14]|uniref:FAD-dependent monooxygenase n=1 Tax=Mucilaginibacter aurantiaciroseus TaxID=2949308 RepID=UPI002091DBCD|nr:FAD-dependent monooxygenase [Mucilaginibacter aurantiaciroseus]MCO5934733.1 FAD-dependent monooxygenase [Mucilaginibacter aurantiaciroseus]
MQSKKVLISGASIAGPTLAFWLNKYGFDVTIVERSAELRLGGQNIDVRDAAIKVAEKMGVANEILAANTGELGIQFIDDKNNVRASFPASGADSFTGEMEIIRGDLVNILYNHTKNDVQYLFGKYITALNETSDEVTVIYSDGLQAKFDLVIAADGVRSKTRELMFGNEADLKYIGIYNVYLTIPKTQTDTNWARWYNAAGSRVIMLRPDNEGTTRASFSFLSPEKNYQKLSRAEQKKFLTKKLSDAGWEAPRLSRGIADSDDFYFDAVSQVIAPRWSKGRLAMIGDAAYCPTPISGMGTSLAIIGAYILAGELSQNTDHSKAFEAFETKLRPYVKLVQNLPPGAPWIVHPKSKWGVKVLNTIAGIIASNFFQRFVKTFKGNQEKKDEFTLPNYSKS